LVKEIPVAARQFVDRLGYVIESAIIEDLVQTAYVQFLRQPWADSWIELVVPNRIASKLTRALKKGGGIHHLCYETDDLDGACRRLRDHSMLMLAKPVAAQAFPGRRIAWFMDSTGLLLELVEQGDGPLGLISISPEGRQN
jgi:methylmalonyl-CoA/ethylmalonyl-CoA epimerase